MTKNPPARPRPSAIVSPRDQWRKVGYRMAPEVQQGLRVVAARAGTDIEVYLDGLVRRHLADLGELAPPKGANR